MELITLHHDACHIQVCPAAGGSIVRFWHENGSLIRDWLRPIHAERITPGNGRDMGSYPLVPYCNRIRAGRFKFQGRDIQLPLNALPQRHSLHGHGWQAQWQVSSQSDDQLTLEYHHAAADWLWEYSVRQHLRVGRQSLQIELHLENLSDQPMPVGLGVHPFFIRTPQTRVFAQTDKIWLVDADIMPQALTEPDPSQDPRQGIRVDRVALDNNFTGWSGLARIEWPEWGAEMTISAEPPLDHLVIYAPPAHPFVCVEPVSQTTDAVNLKSPETGLRVLEAGAMLSATAKFSYAFIGDS